MRTDRCHHYYYGSSDDDNENVRALLNILTTYALNHKDKYCQGMSDLASPLLYAMKGIYENIEFVAKQSNHVIFFCR
jgi:hypothetical protein